MAARHKLKFWQSWIETWGDLLNEKSPGLGWYRIYNNKRLKIVYNGGGKLPKNLAQPVVANIAGHLASSVPADMYLV